MKIKLVRDTKGIMGFPKQGIVFSEGENEWTNILPMVMSLEPKLDDAGYEWNLRTVLGGWVGSSGKTGYKAAMKEILSKYANTELDGWFRFDGGEFFAKKR